MANLQNTQIEYVILVDFANMDNLIYTEDMTSDDELSEITLERHRVPVWSLGTALSLNKSPAERNNSFFCTHRDSLMDSTFSKNEITDSSGVPLKDIFHLYGKIGLGLEKTGAGGILSTGVLVAGETFSSSSASNLKRSRSKRCFMAS
nr:unnamed protein product [Callosobruchus analis]